MKNNFQTITIFSFLVMMLSSCSDFFETTLTLDAPPFEKKLVIIGEAKEGDSVIQIRVTENFGILDDKKDTTVINPQLVFTVNGIEQTNKSYLNGFFTVRLKESLKVGQKCDIQVSHSGFKTAFVTQTVPSLLNLKSVKFVENGGITSDGDQRSKVDVTITDIAGKDFYEVLLLVRTSKDQPFRAVSTDLNEPGVVSSLRNSGSVISDQTFDGKDKTLSLQFYKVSEQQAKGNIQLRWRNVSEDYFKFSKTGQVHFDSRDNPFSTPSDVYTNVSDGLGYFFVHNQKTYNVQ